MTCYYPVKGYRGKYVNPETGKRPIVFNTTDGFKDLPITIPCGRCRGCRLDYSRQWAVRCVHEAQMHEANAFITLTYNKENLPENRSIDKEVFKKFMKRLRRQIERDFGIKNIRYFACGEYGTQRNRPHYHAIIFGCDFPDKLLHSKRNGNLLFRSKCLEKSWKYGYSSVGHCTFESAAYVARYVMKKYNNQDEEKEFVRYSIVDPENGEVFKLQKEFCLMSRKPGIGRTWLEKYKSDTDKDFITVNGKKMSLPKYYDSLLENVFNEDMEDRKSQRKRKINKEDNTPDRLRIKDNVKKVTIKQLKRSFETEDYKP